MQNQQPKTEEIIVPTKVSVFEDRKSKVRTVAFPFTFPDGVHGGVMITRLKQTPWVPAMHIEKVVIHFTTPQNNEDSTNR